MTCCSACIPTAARVKDWRTTRCANATKAGTSFELASFTDDKRYIPLVGETFEFPISDCTSEGVVLRSPLVFLIPTPATSTQYATWFQLGSKAADATAHTTPSSRNGNLRPVTYTNNAETVVTSAIADFLITAVMGAVLPANYTATHSGVAMLGPYYPIAGLTPSFRREWLYTHATLEQQLYAVGQAAQHYKWDLSIVIRGGSADAIADVAVRSLHTFGLEPLSVRTMASSSNTFSGMLHISQPTLMVGVVATDIPDIIAHLAVNAMASVVLTFDELASFFDAMVQQNRRVATTAVARAHLLCHVAP